MINPKDFLDVYIKHRTCSNGEIGQAMLQLTQSTTEAERWRLRCQVWMNDTEFGGNFTAAVNLYRMGTFDSIAQLSAKIKECTQVCTQVAATNARAIWGFDGRSNPPKPIAEMYEYWLNNQHMSGVDLAAWGNHVGSSASTALINVHKRDDSVLNMIAIWNAGIAAGDTKCEMLSRFSALGVPQSGSHRYVIACGLVDGIRLDPGNSRVYLEQLIAGCPGMGVTDYVAMGVMLGLKAAACQRQLMVMMRLRMYQDIQDDMFYSEAKIREANLLSDSRELDVWIDQMTLLGCCATSAYQWRTNLEKA